jgi:hypothetical protein
MNEAKTRSANSSGVAIGCFAAAAIVAVLFAIAFTSLWYFGFVQRGGVYDGLRVQLAQTELNQLVPYVELYRTERGVYPVHIDQISAIIPRDVPVLTIDPSAPPTGPQRSFFYEKVGDNHYRLRGVGADGVAFTRDDIVPQGFQSGGIGLLLDRPRASDPNNTPSSDSPR